MNSILFYYSSLVNLPYNLLIARVQQKFRLNDFLKVEHTYLFYLKHQCKSMKTKCIMSGSEREFQVFGFISNGTLHSLPYSQVPIERVYSIIILRLFFHPTCTFSTLLD